jgi:hypothetical protein
MRLMALWVGGILFFLSNPVLAQRTSCAVSLSQFSRLTSGMTYGQVVRVLGCAGLEMNTVEHPGFVTITYYWTGRGAGDASMSAVIQNNLLMSVYQTGLRD